MLLLARDGSVVAVPGAHVPQSLLLAGLAACTRVVEPVPVLVARDALEHVLQLMAHCAPPAAGGSEPAEIRACPEVVRVLERLGSEQLGDVANAANYLSCPVLLEHVCKFIAERMQEGSPAELHALFGAGDALGDDARAGIEDAFGWVSSTDDSE